MVVAQAGVDTVVTGSSRLPYGRPPRYRGNSNQRIKDIANRVLRLEDGAFQEVAPPTPQDSLSPVHQTIKG